MGVILTKCSRQAQSGFEDICKCLPGGVDSKLFGLQISRLRNVLSFHYDRDHINNALDRLAVENAPAMITMGGDYYLSRFNLADRVCDSVLVHQVLQEITRDSKHSKQRETSCVHEFREQKMFGFSFLRPRIFRNIFQSLMRSCTGTGQRESELRRALRAKDQALVAISGEDFELESA